MFFIQGCDFYGMNRPLSSFYPQYSFVLPILLGMLACTACSQEVDTSSNEIKDEIVDQAEVMPRFPGCEHLDLASDMARYQCSVQLLMDYISSGVSYPEAARKKGTSGEAVVQFIVQKDGSVTFSQILQDPGDGLGAMAEAQIRRMEREGVKWRPGYKEGKPIAVRFNLPVSFTLPRDPDTGRIPSEN